MEFVFIYNGLFLYAFGVILCLDCFDLTHCYADASGLATTDDPRRRRIGPSLRKNAKDFMSRAFLKQSRHNITPKAYKFFKGLTITNLYRICCLLLFAALTSCSVHTLYGYDSAVYNKLASVKLGSVEGKDMYLIRQSFYQEFYSNEANAIKAKGYQLNMKFTESLAGWITQKDSTILKNSMSMVVNFELTDLKTGKVLKKGSVRALRIFLESASAWSSYMSEKKARETAIVEGIRLVKAEVVISLIKRANENQSKAS